MRAFVVAMVVAIGCGSESEEKECKRSDRSGMYLVEYDVVSGDCGPIDAALVDMSAQGDEWSSACSYSYNRWSDDACSNETSFVCSGSEYDLWATGKAEFEPGGAHGEGIISMDIRDQSGWSVCDGVYRVTYTRQ
jgi:hypothetical protein